MYYLSPKNGCRRGSIRNQACLRCWEAGELSGRCRAFFGSDHTGGSHQFSLYYADLLRIGYKNDSRYHSFDSFVVFFLVISGRFLAEAVVMNCWEIICASYEFWIRQVETGRLTVWVLHPWHMWIYVAMCPPFPQFPPPPGTPGRPDESNKSWWTTLDHQQWLNFMNC